MAITSLPNIKDLEAFQNRLFSEYSIEIPCIEWNDRQFLRISIQAYNTQDDVDALLAALRDLLPEI
jgi:isopenicillin-N epimerase